MGIAVGNAVSPDRDGSSESLWLPTCCLHLLQRICKARPNHLLIAADFDELPDVALPGQGAPLVASMVCPIPAQHLSHIPCGPHALAGLHTYCIALSIHTA